MLAVAVRGRYLKGDGTAAAGQVTFSPRPNGVSDPGNGDILVSSAVTATLDADGSFAVTLQASDDLSIAPSGWTYAVSERIAGAREVREYDIDIPTSAAVTGIDLWDVAPASATSGDPTTFPTLAAFAALEGRVGTLETTYAPLASPALAGVPLAPSPLAGVRTPQIASTQHVLDSLGEVGAGPSYILPPAAVLAASTAAAWYTTNAATLMRFSLTRTRTFRYINLHVGVQSGNIQVGVCREASGSGNDYVTRVAHSGVIACPAAGAQKIDLGFFTLSPGDYAVFLWCDNTTASFLHGLSTGIAASRASFSTTVSGGITAAKTQVSGTTRWVTGLSLEAASFPTVLFGDSITLNQSWWTAMDDATGNRFSVSPVIASPLSGTNAGVAGNTTAQMLTRVATDVVALAPRYVSVLGGTNDVGAAVGAATTIANLAAIYDALVAGGAKFVACTIPPRTGLASDQALNLRTVNAWIRTHYANWAGARLCDWAWTLSDGTDESSPLADNFLDGVHPNAAGAALMAPLMARAVSTWV